MFAKQIDGCPEKLFAHNISTKPTKRSWRRCCRGSQNESVSARLADSQHSRDIGINMGVGLDYLLLKISAGICSKSNMTYTDNLC